MAPPLLTVLAATRGGAQDGAVLTAVEGVAVAVQGVMEASEVPERHQMPLLCVFNCGRK